MPNSSDACDSWGVNDSYLCDVARSWPEATLGGVRMGVAPGPEIYFDQADRVTDRLKAARHQALLANRAHMEGPIAQN